MTLYFRIHCHIRRAFGIALEKVFVHVILYDNYLVLRCPLNHTTKTCRVDIIISMHMLQNLRKSILQFLVFFFLLCCEVGGTVKSAFFSSNLNVKITKCGLNLQKLLLWALAWVLQWGSRIDFATCGYRDLRIFSFSVHV